MFKKCMSVPSPKPESDAAARVPQRPRGHARVAALLDAATSVFAHDGYDAATMTEVAACAGASIGSLYQFFPTKALLAEALYQREMDALAVALNQAVDGLRAAPCSLATLADQLFATLVDFCASHPALPVVAERREADAVRQSKIRPNMREQLTELLGRAEPLPTPKQVQHAAILSLRMMKAAVSVQTHQDPGAENLIEDIRAMLRWRLANLSVSRTPHGKAREF